MGSGLIDQVASGEAPPLVPLTVEQLHRMLEKGIIRDGDPIELVEGLLVRKNRAASGEGERTHGALHAQILTRLMRLERALEPLGCHLRVQLPVTLSALSEPEPDLAAGGRRRLRFRASVARIVREPVGRRANDPLRSHQGGTKV